MAGARLGYAIGDAALIQDLEAIRFSTNPYNVNRLTLRAGAAALAEQDYYDANCAAIVDTRADTKRRLEALGFTCTDSRANFLFARHPAADGGDLYRRLKERGVLVRRFDAPASGTISASPSVPGPRWTPCWNGWRDCYENRPHCAQDQ